MRSMFWFALAAGCSSSASMNPADMTVRLLASDYSLGAGEEKYLCQRKTMTSDMWITRITPVNGLATHHEVLGVDTTGMYPDGAASCGGAAEFDPLRWRMLFASGVNSPSLDMPEGVAIKVAKGEQIVFQMHLLNAALTPVTSSAAIDVKLLGSGTPTEAQMLLAGPMPDHRVTPDIPVGDDQHVEGQCTLKGDVHLFALFPHMHQIGKHIKVYLGIGADKSHVLYDADYNFNNQEFAQFAPVDLKKGDEIDITCIYNNDTSMPVQFGQSSLQEMCFSISYIYPPLPTGALGDFCTN